jgi:protoporphyrinogen oxidase
MLPYNRKVWTCDPGEMSVDWIRERVPTVRLRRLARSVLLRRDVTDWGPNSRFRYPRRGGTGAIWNAVHRSLPTGSFNFGKEIVRIEARARIAHCTDGEAIPYDLLLSTAPLDRLATMLQGEVAALSAARRLRRSTTTLLGLGFRDAVPEALRGKSWVYFPESRFPFYRLTVLSNFSPANVPPGEPAWSILCEVGERPGELEDSEELAVRTLGALRNANLVPGEAPASTWRLRLPYGYPVPSLERDELLDAADAALRPLGIFSRGRFGGWKYEVSNQDHSFMQGVEFVDHVLRGEPERTYPTPERVNSSGM